MRQLILLCLVITALCPQGLFADGHNIGDNSLTVVDPPRPPRVDFKPFLCFDEQTDVVLFLIDREAGVDYTWNIPASIDPETTFSANGDTVFIADITALNPLFEIIEVTATNSCGSVTERPFIELGAPLAIPEEPLDTFCTGSSIRINPFFSSRIVRYDWTFNGGELVSGEPGDEEPFSIRYDAQGLQSYTLMATDQNGCQHTQTYQVMIYDAPPQPAIQCTSLPDRVMLNWIEDPNFTYNINTSQFDSNLTGMMTGAAEMTVTGFVSASGAFDPCQFAIFTVEVFGTNPAPCDMAIETSLCRPSPRPEFVFEHNPNKTTHCVGDAPIVTELVAIVNGEANPVTGHWGTTSSQTELDGGFEIDPDCRTGRWDPTGQAIGDYVIQYTYTNPDDGCTTRDAEFFTVMERALPNARIDKTDICADDEVIVTFSRYEDLPAPNVFVNTTVGGLEVETLTDSTRRITFGNFDETYEVVVAYDNIPDCEPNIESVFVTTSAKPEIDLACGTEETDAINLEWNDLGLEAIVTLNGNNPVTTLSNTLRIDGLATDTGYEVIINIETLTCGIVSDTIVCRTTSCVPAMVDLSNVPTDPICYDPEAGVPIPLNVNIAPGAPGIIGDFTWDTPLVDEFNNFTPNDNTIRDYVLTAVYADENGCSERIPVPVSVLFQPRPFLEASVNTVCLQNGQVSLQSNNIDGNVILQLDDPLPAGATLINSTARNFEIAFAAVGDYTIGMVANLEGCEGPREEVTITVEDTPVLDARCANQGEDSVTLAWNDIGVPVTIRQDGIDIASNQSNTTFDVTGLPANTTFEFVVSANDPSCGLIEETFSCVTFACVDPEVVSNVPASPICWDVATMGGFPLDVTVQPGTGGAPGIFAFDSPLVDANNEFTPIDPLQVNYSIDGIYSDDDGCVETITIDFIFVQTPEVALSLIGADTLCGDMAEVTLVGDFAGLVPDEIVYVPEFPAGVNSTEVSPGQYTLTFDGPGTYDVGLRVDYFGCEGVTVNQEIYVMATPKLNLKCGDEEDTSVTVLWDDIGADDYQVFLDGLPQASSNMTETTIGNLQMGLTYDVVIETLIPDCGLVRDMVTCRTFVCPPVTMDFSGVPDVVCHDSRTGPFLLDVSISSMDPNANGRFEWDTPLVDENNMFTPDPNITEYNLDILYTDDNDCVDAFTLSFTYLESHRPDIQILSNDSICMNGESIQIMSNYTSQGGGPVIYTTDFPSEAVVQSGSDAGPYEITFTQEGTYQLGIAVEDNGCPGTVEFVEVTVEPDIGMPDVTSAGTFGGIELSWDPMNCVSTYKIFIDGEFVENVSGTSTTIIGLEGEQEFEWIVEPISNCRCTGEVARGRETTEACPVPTITVFPVDTCFGADVPPFALEVDVQTTGEIAGGEGDWTGPLIDINRLVDISFAREPGIFEMEYTFVEGGCETIVPVNVELTEPPTLEVDPISIQCGEDVSGTVIVSVLGGTPDFGFSLNGGEVQPENIFEDVEVGSFFVEVSDGNGCLVSVSDNIVDSDLSPEVEIEGENVVVEGSNEEFFLELEDIDPDMVTNIIWTFNGNNICEGLLCDPVLLENVVDTGVLQVVVELEGFCELTASKTLDVNFVNDVYIPNVADLSGTALPPNNQWTAFVKGAETFISRVQVFDRWGNKVRDFENNSLEYFNEFLIWDGFFGSEPAEQGVYTYVIELLIEGEPEIRFGSVTIFR